MAADPIAAAPPAARPARGGAARWVLGLAALVPVGAYLVVAALRVGYPYELTYFEGSTVEVTARVVAGQPLYTAPDTIWTPWPYPPLYFWLSGAVARLTGLSLLPMRLVSLVASMVAIGFVGLIVRRAGGSTVAGLVAAGVFTATYRVSGAWFDTARVDSLLVALLLASVHVGMRVRTARGGVVLGALLFLAFLTKQNALLVAAPVLLWLVVRRRRVGWVAAVSLAVALVASTLVGDLLTGGWYSRYVVRQLVSQSWALHWLYDFWWLDLLLPFGVSAAAVAVALLVRWWLARRRVSQEASSRTPGDDTAYLLAAALGLVGTAWAARLHEGGYANVAIPAHAAVAIALGCATASLLRSDAATSRVVAVLAVAVLAQTATMTSWQADIVPSTADRAAGDRFVAALAALPGRVLVPTHPYYVRQAGMPPSASAIAVYDLLHATGGRQDLGSSLPWSLDGVSSVVLDNEIDVQLFDGVLAREFTLVSTTFVPEGVFIPVTDLPTHPTVLYVRTTELGRLAPQPAG